MITTLKHSQPSLQKFGFHKNSKNNKKKISEDIKKAQDEFIKKGDEIFVAGIAINLLKVEPGTFAKMDNGQSADMEATPTLIPDKNPNFVGQSLTKESNKKDKLKPQDDKSSDGTSERNRNDNKNKCTDNENSHEKNEKEKLQQNNNDEYKSENDNDIFTISLKMLKQIKR